MEGYNRNFQNTLPGHSKQKPYILKNILCQLLLLYFFKIADFLLDSFVGNFHDTFLLHPENTLNFSACCFKCPGSGNVLPNLLTL